MRILKVICGIAILLNALHLEHAVHHFYGLDPDHGAGFWAGMTLAVTVGILSLIGGCLLIRSAARTPKQP